MNLRVVVIDDEYLSRQEIIFLLNKLSWVKIIGEANCGIDGLSIIKELQPDLILVDIQMPDITGICLSKELEKLGVKSKVIFTTAYDEYAIQAFEVNAVDYILKPYDQERVIKSLVRTRQLIENNSYSIYKPTPIISPIKKLPVWKEDKLFLIEIDDILYAYTEGRDILIKTLKQSYISNYSLQELEEKLESSGFFRCHRSYLINMNQIREVSPWFNGAYTAKFDGIKEDIPISRNQVKKFKDLLDI